MTYKQIETSREIRLWIGQVLIPAGLVVGTVMSNPDAKEAVKKKYNKTKKWVTDKFKKKEERP